MVKLLDYEARLAELEESRNPFAIVTLAHLKTLTTRRQPKIRFQWKVSLIKKLYEKGYARQDILELLRFIDWVMLLPADLERQFIKTAERYEEERTMKYVTSFERYGIEKGLQQGLQQGLQRGALETSRQYLSEVLNARFAHVPPAIVTTINRLENLALLKELLRKAVMIGSLEEFQAVLERQC